MVSLGARLFATYSNTDLYISTFRKGMEVNILNYHVRGSTRGLFRGYDKSTHTIFKKKSFINASFDMKFRFLQFLLTYSYLICVKVTKKCWTFKKKSGVMYVLAILISQRIFGLPGVKYANTPN